MEKTQDVSAWLVFNSILYIIWCSVVCFLTCYWTGVKRVWVLVSFQCLLDAGGLSTSRESFCVLQCGKYKMTFLMVWSKTYGKYRGGE